jgi:tellurite resistance protein
MTEFTDQRAIRRHGPDFARARDMLCVAMVVADAEGRLAPADVAAMARQAGRLPGLGRIDEVGLLQAGERARDILASDGVEQTFARAAARLDRHDAAAAMLLACELASEGGADGAAVLRPMARRLGIGPDRLTAIKILADRRRFGGQAAA